MTTEQVNQELRSWGNGWTKAEMLTDNGNRWAVQSSNGKRRYNVTFEGRGDSDEVSLWGCDCPAGVHGKTCKHIRLVGDICGRLF